jgi:hypothetical protein
MILSTRSHDSSAVVGISVTSQVSDVGRIWRSESVFPLEISTIATAQNSSWKSSRSVRTVRDQAVPIGRWIRAPPVMDMASMLRNICWPPEFTSRCKFSASLVEARVRLSSTNVLCAAGAEW